MADLFAKVDVKLPPFPVPQAFGFQVESNEKWNGFDIKVPHGEIFYAESFFPRRISDRTSEYLQENDAVDWRAASWRDIGPEELERIEFKNVRWKQDWISFYGKRFPLPRLTSWYGDPGRSYAYSGIKSEPNPWNDGLLYLKIRLKYVPNPRSIVCY